MTTHDNLNSYEKMRRSNASKEKINQYIQNTCEETFGEQCYEFIVIDQTAEEVLQDIADAEKFLKDNTKEKHNS